MSFYIYPNTIIYIVVPKNFSTGGVDALFNLGEFIQRMNIAKVKYYFIGKSKNIMHQNYKDFRISTANKIVDEENNIIIVPETFTNVLFNFNNIRKIIWWLSVDFYFVSKKNYYSGVKGKIRKIINYIYPKFRLYNFDDEKIIHFVQSYYAMEFLKKQNINKIFYLSDFTKDEIISASQKINTNSMTKNKKNIVLYNPKKGYEFTAKLIETCSDEKFVPIINMTPKEVVEKLIESKVYIDFGFHPGKDRIPREAAMLNCIVITNKKGSAKFKTDVPIPDEYKFDDELKNLHIICNKIRECLDNYEIKYLDFENYRNIIRDEKAKFQKDLRKIFIPYEA